MHSKHDLLTLSRYHKILTQTKTKTCYQSKQNSDHFITFGHCRRQRISSTRNIQRTKEETFNVQIQTEKQKEKQYPTY